MAEAEEQGQSRLRVPFPPAQRRPGGSRNSSQRCRHVALGPSPVLALLASRAWPAGRLDTTFWDLIQMPSFPTLTSIDPFKIDAFREGN